MKMPIDITECEKKFCCQCSRYIIVILRKPDRELYCPNCFSPNIINIYLNDAKLLGSPAIGFCLDEQPRTVICRGEENGCHFAHNERNSVYRKHFTKSVHLAHHRDGTNL